MTLSEYLATRRISPIRFAETIGVRYQSVYRYLACERIPHPAVMHRIAKVTHGHVLPNDFYRPIRPPQEAA